MTCADSHRLVSRDTLLGSVGVAQCLDCSEVFQAAGWTHRTCGQCGLSWGESLHDPCLGQIKGAVEACCGHGDESRRYVSYPDGSRKGVVVNPVPLVVGV